MQKIQFYAGEERHVRITVHALNDEPFGIRDATWELIQAGKTEAEGECIVDGHVIDAFIAPKNKTTYVLEIAYRVADETLKEKIEVAVE